MNNISKNPQNNQEPLVSVNLVVYNGEKYIRQCLDSVLAQTYKNIEVNILDNASTDSTVKIISSGYYDTMIYHSGTERGLNLVKSEKNLGMWPGQEELLKYSHGKYIVALSVDIILNENFITEAVKVLEEDEKIGAIQPKVYKYEFPYIQNTKYKILDTVGFQIFRSRRIVNIGHGEIDRGQYDSAEILDSRPETRALNNKLSARPSTYRVSARVFAVEGAVPVLRRQAMEDCRLKSQGNKIVDPDFFWYGDDLDLTWRIGLFGWKQVFAPKAIAWHDRQTTKALAGNWREFIKIRKTIPTFKKRLDWRNTTLAIIKNDFVVNLLRDLPFILWRQLRLWGYFLLFETSMIFEIFRVAKILPKMLKRRGEIMRRARVSAREMRKRFSAE